MLRSVWLPGAGMEADARYGAATRGVLYVRPCKGAFSHFFGESAKAGEAIIAPTHAAASGANSTLSHK